MQPERPLLKSHNRWIASVMWVVLLVVLVFTSANGSTFAFGGTLATALRFLNNPPDSANSQGGSLIFAVVSLALTGAIVYQLLRAWLNFVDMTHQLVISYAAAEQPSGTDSVFTDMLEFSEPDAMEGDQESEAAAANEPDPADSDSSSMSNVLKPLAYAWIIILLSPSVIAMAAALFAR